VVKIRVKQVLEERKISMGKLSRMSDVSFSTIRRICNDADYSPSLETLEKLARSLGVRIADLYHEEETEE
jgi:transcriptional regulator with XRE-family HTH domain